MEKAKPLALKEKVECRICNESFIYFVPIEKSASQFPETVLAEKVIVEDYVNEKKSAVVLKVHVECPKCGFVNEYKSSLSK